MLPLPLTQLLNPTPKSHHRPIQLPTIQRRNLLQPLLLPLLLRLLPPIQTPRIPLLHLGRLSQPLRLRHRRLLHRLQQLGLLLHPLNLLPPPNLIRHHLLMQLLLAHPRRRPLRRSGRHIRQRRQPTSPLTLLLRPRRLRRRAGNRAPRV